MQKTNNQTKTGQFKSNEQTLRHRSTKDEYKHYNRENKRMKQTKTGELMSKEQTETQKYNRKEQTLRKVQEQRADTITKSTRVHTSQKLPIRPKWQNKQESKGWKKTEQTTVQESVTRLQNKQKYRRTTVQKKEKRWVQEYTTNKSKVQDDRMTEQTLRHRNTGVQNRQKQRGSRGENKQKTTIIL